MTTSSCCKNLNRKYQIRTPQDLREVIRATRDKLADGTLVETNYWPEGRPKIDMPDFHTLWENGQWGDYLEYYFSCSECKRLFRLSSETYHGSGGSWSPV